jgi:hypothetical protein
VLTDFGIARSAAATHRTSTGLLMGTASYIAPERAGGQPASARSDIYSLGVVAYQCLAGRLPFEGESLLQIALRHANDEPPPLPADVPAAVREIVARALAKDPADRWPSGAAMAEAARSAAANAAAPTRAETAPVRPRRRLLVVGGAVLAVAVAAAALLASLGRGHAPPSNDAAAGPGATEAAAVGGLNGIPVAGGSATASASALPGTAGRSAVPAAPSPTPVAAGAPAAPSGLRATPVGAATIRLQWADNSGNETGFSVLNGAVSRTAGAGATSYDWDGLAPDTYMCFKVRAFNAAGASAYFPPAQPDWVCATSLAGTGPAAPGGLTATPTGPTAVRLQWADNSDNETGFTVINGTASRNAAAGATSYTWDGLSPGTYMCFKVRAFNAAGVSPYAPPAQQDWACATTPAA